MSQKMIESFLEKKIGLSAEAIGPEVIAKTVRLRMAELGLPDIKGYYDYLKTSEKEQDILIEGTVVLETWFFRNKNAFVFLINYVTEKWLPKHRSNHLRILSVPCSTGEEPYSIAMVLMDAGINNNRFRIDGTDISEAALGRARSGVYDRGSFRGDDLSFRERYFEPKGDTYQIDASVRKAVRFIRGNVLDDRLLIDEAPYDIIFCRNLLIYLSPQAKQRTLESMDRLLANAGILFVGHAERQTAIEWGFAGIPGFGAFACRKERRKRERSLKPNAHGQPRPRQRLFETVGKKLQTITPVTTAHSFNKASESRILSRQSDKMGTLGDDRKDLFDEAQRLADRGSLNSALALCRDFLIEHPVHVEAHFLMGLIYESLDNKEKAEELFNKAVYLNPNHSEALNYLAFIVEHRGDKGRAAHLRKRAQRVSRKQAES